MKRILLLCLIIFTAFIQPLQAQTAAQKKSTDRADFSEFKKQIMALKEFKDEKAKVSGIRRENKGQLVKVIAMVDKESATDDDAPADMLTGYIKQVVGTDSSTVYEIQYDRKEKKIISVQPTGEGLDPDNAVKKHGKRSKDEDEDDPDRKERSKKENDDDN